MPLPPLLLALAAIAPPEPPAAGPPSVGPSATVAVAAPDPDAPGAAPTRVRAAILAGEGIDLAALQAALQRRLPDLALGPESAPPAAAGPGLQGHVRVQPAGPGVFTLRLVLSDGRAFVREVETDADAAAVRALAGMLASLIPAIEEASVAADEEDAPLPEPLVAAVAAAEPPPAPPPEPAPEPRPGATPAPPPAEPAGPAEAPPPRLELGPTVAAGGLIGIGTTSAGWRGAALHLGLDLRTRRGLGLGLDLRHTTWGVERYRLGRLRVGVTIGATLRVQALEVPIHAILAVEPWWLRDGDAAVPLDHAGDGGAPRPLLGAGVRLSPGYRARFGEDGRIHLRLGARFEATGSGEPRNGLRAPRLAAAGAAPLLGFGGLEFACGLELSLSIAPRPLVARPPAR